MTLKGQKQPKEAVLKQKESMKKRLSSLYKWEIIEPYLDIKISNGAGKRTKKFITLREFKENIKNGCSLLDMKKQGISKHLIGFYSIFSQGKIILSEEDFKTEYKKGSSLDEIAKKYNIEKGCMSFLRQFYDIKRKGATFINRKKTEIPLTQRQKDILYGSMMGDAKRANKWNSSAGFGQGYKQKEYLMWKYEEFKCVAIESSLRFCPSYDKREEFKNFQGSWRFRTKANSDIEKCMNKFYGENGKQITNDILDHLTELSLSVWMMDDGTTYFGYKKRERTGKEFTPEIKLCTDSFSLESCNNIVEWFKERWGITSHLRERGLRKDGGMSYRIIINSISAYDFISLIKPHIIPSMLYKVDYKAYKSYRAEKEKEQLLTISLVKRVNIAYNSNNYDKN